MVEADETAAVKIQDEMAVVREVSTVENVAVALKPLSVGSG